MSSTLAIITARGGSKAIPGKNVAMLADKPLIAWTIDAAKKSKVLTRCIVSTDDTEIAETARKYGADVPFLRPPELAGDDAPHLPVMMHAITWMQEHENFLPEFILLLQPTSPLRTTEDIDASFAILQQKKADSVVSVSPAASHPYLVKRMNEEGRLEQFMPIPEGYLPRQALPPVYAVNGAIYWVRHDVFMKQKTFYTDKTYAYVMPEERSLDIDTPWHLRLAECALTHLKT